jgi:gliding motility-associated-like protein
MITGFDRYITDIEWFFEAGDEPTTMTPYNSTKDTIAVWWANSIENGDFNHGVSVKTTNIWGCEYRIFPPDTVYAPLPAYVRWIDNEKPTCGECDGELSFENYSNEFTSPLQYSVEWANNPNLNNAQDNIILPDSTLYLKDLCASEYYLVVSYQSVIQGNCNDTLMFNLHADSSTIASSNFEFLVEDMDDIQAPFELGNTTINNTSQNANKYTWQVFNGLEEDLAMLVYEGNEAIPDYIFSNMGEYLIKLQAFNDKAPNCPATPVNKTIFVHYESVLEVPNIFTPNEDGFNDQFRVKARELQTYKCVIYNRWGQKVFETDDSEESWNGKMKNDGSDLSSGTYYYIVTGTGKKGQEFEFKGAVQLMREK